MDRHEVLQAMLTAGRNYSVNVQDLRALVLKLLVLPAVVLLTAHFVFGVGGLSLAVLVMMAAAPVGSNALIFAQRYRTQEAEATAAIVLSTVAFVFTSSMWVAVLALLGW
jgi:predicted permease